MKVSRKWLSDYIDLPDDHEELRTAFVSMGHVVDNMEFLEPQWTEVVVGRVERVRPHPNADKVRLCTVNTGSESIEVVCGAWNFDAGAKVAFARAGAKLAGGVEIGRRDIRGVKSEGMILSERELGLGDDHSGILVLDHDAPTGVDFTELVALPDVVYDIAITPNRPDVMSMVGMARELAAYFQVPYSLPPTEPTTVPGDIKVKVQIMDSTGCYRFVARELINARIGPSPFWMRHRLRVSGVRPISNVVDVTNYVMLELGQPLHAFDLDKVEQEKIIVRRAKPGERLVTLDGVDRSLTPDDLVVADANRASGLAGTMGGLDSEVTESTTRVLIEAAAWDPPTIMFMSRRHGLRSEASSRFERGADPNLPPLAAARAARLMVELTGGDTLAGWIDEVAAPIEPVQIELPLSEVTRITGDEVLLDQVAPLLRRLHLEVEGEDPLTVTAPTYRRDLTRPIDLVEEVARLHGLDRFPATLPTGAEGGWSAEQRRHRTLRGLLTGAGLSQAVNLAFQGPGDLDAFGYPPDHEARLTIKVKNPLNDELASLRTSLVPGLLRSVRYSHTRGLPDVALFEVGRVFFARPWDEDPRIPDQPERLGFAVAGGFGPRGLDVEARSADVYSGIAIWRLLAHGLDLGRYELRPAQVSGFHPGRTSEVWVNERPIGHVGEIHPLTVAAYGLEGRIAAGELALAPLLAPTPAWQLREPSVFPPVEFDLAFVVDEESPASRLLETTARAGGEQLESVRVFDEYRGAGLPKRKKSLALRYLFRDTERTLNADDVAAIRAKLIEAAAGLGATLRGATK